MSSALADCFLRVCSRAPAAVAIRDFSDGAAITYDALRESFLVTRRALRELALSDGAPIVSCLGNHAIFFPFIAASIDAGCSLLPLGEATDAELLQAIDRSGAVAVVTNRFLPLSGRAERSLAPGVRLVLLQGRTEPAAHGCAVILKLTSGSTNAPRAAIAEEDHLINDGRHVIEAMGLTAADVNFGCIPLSHSYGLGNLVMPLLLQGTGVALRRSFNIATLVRDLECSGATVWPGVPFMFERVEQALHPEPLPSSLRLLITAGARIQLDTVRWFHARLGRKLHSFYGTSETGGITFDDSEEVAEVVHVGRPLPETEVCVVRTGPDSGRILVHGTAVASRYSSVRGRSEGVARFSNGGFLTGDLGSFNAAGQLVLTGRVSTAVHVAGRKVDPHDVEQMLLTIPGVSDVRVIGIPCARRGQQVVAVVVTTDRSLTPVILRQMCAPRLSPHKIPRHFVFVDRLPVDARGKVDRRVLHALASGDAHT
jgi:long-chain acyl-CoA synthetase